MKTEKLFRRQFPFTLGACILAAALLASPARPSAEGVSTGTLEVSITSPTFFPPDFTLNPVGVFPSNIALPDAGNTGNGDFVALGSATCTPVGCTSEPSDTDLEYQLTTNLACTSESPGTYGGLEDSAAFLVADNDTGSNVSFDLNFASSWSISASADSPPETDSAAASIFINWTVPNDFCIQLVNCPAGFLTGGVPSTCPPGFVTATSLRLGDAEVDTSLGDDSTVGPVSSCDVAVVVLSGANTGGTLGVTSTCSANSSGLIFMDGFESGDLSAWSAQIP